ncbi:MULTISPECIES: GNAT family N-acetyltransferase [Aeromonas]|uniref:GNAT family N-acetyltransferase n=1 Tax=Aeromonas TaxID=642 RepID=UPI001F1C83F6|nr:MULTISPECIES: GNAT family N-acetyltransferase [Aeromonas]MCE9932678.1 GNAT family N-acetyltransferase [Aeromonas salmonicida]MDX7711779.1 GNAT family N-acetyltransferase [Aeromonas caviae]
MATAEKENPKIERLTAEHLQMPFHSASERMNRFFAEFALPEQELGISSTYCLVDEDGVLGFFTLCQGSVLKETLGYKTRYKDVPVVRIGRLAVTEECERTGLGRHLVAFALKEAREVRKTAGAVALVVDAVPEAVDFYQKCDFKAVGESSGSKTVFMAMSLNDKRG